MDYRHSTVAILALGGLVLALEPGLPDPPFGTGSASWVPVAGVYILVGGLLGLRRFPGTDLTTVRYAILIAAVSSLLPMGLRVRDLLIARPELALADATFVLTQDAVFLPVVAGFMAPLGLAEDSEGRLLARAALVALVLVFVIGATLTVPGTGFGTAFIVITYSFGAVAGVLLGLPLYLYGWSLRDETPEIVRRLFFPRRLPP